MQFCPEVSASPILVMGSVTSNGVSEGIINWVKNWVCSGVGEGVHNGAIYIKNGFFK